MYSVLLTLALTLTAGDAPKPEPLWPKGRPGAVGGKDADKPTLTHSSRRPTRPTARPSSSVPAAATAASPRP